MNRTHWGAWLGALGLAAGAGLACAQQGSGDALVSTPSQVKLGIENLKLPGDEHMGLIGTSYLIGIGHGLSIGPAVYGAVSGHRGGLFTLGAEAAWQQPLAGPLAIDLGFYAGGGGGGSAPVGGGLMLRPHADLLWDFGPFLAGVSWSQVRFANGGIDSRQLGLVWSAKTDFRYLPGDRIGVRSEMGGRSGLGFDRIQAVVGSYRPHGSRRVSGGPLDSTIVTVGTRAERAIGDRAYWGVEAAGAASGGVGGYAEYLATLGTETTVWPGVLTLGTRVAAGMGGGGEVAVGGGLLVKAGVYGTVRLTRALGLSLEAGATDAPRGSFKALHVAASLNWILDDPGDLGAPPRNTRTEWIGGIESYDAQRRYGSRHPLQAVILQANRFVSPHVYLAGQAHSAYDGDAGGYTAGLFGAGFEAPLFGPVRGGVEALIGAAGGGGVSTEGGAIMQPHAHLLVDLGPSWSVRLGAGRIKALRGGALNANVVDVTMAFTFGVTEHGRR